MPSRLFWSMARVLLGIVAIVSPLRAESPDPAALIEAGADLGSSSYAKREAATQFLWRHAGAARSLLEDARRSPDPEIRLRAARIWEVTQLGILPDTPPDVVRQIYAFHDADHQKKRAIIQELVAADNLSTAYRLLRSVKEDGLRKNLAQGLAAQVRSKLVPHLLDEAWDRAEPLLVNAALSDLGMRDYAAFAFLTDRLGTAQSEDPGTASERRLRTWLLRAAGRMEEAHDLVEKEDPSLARAIRIANGDALAFCQFELTQPNVSRLQQLRAQAFQARLTEDAATFDRAIADLMTLAKNEGNIHNRRFIIEALLLNDVVEPALPFIPKRAPQNIYRVQDYRGMYREALRAIGIDEPKPPYTAWVEERCRAFQEKNEAEAFFELLNLAEQLADMGELEETTRIFDLAFAATENDLDRRKTLVGLELDLGARQSAEARLRELAKSGVPIDQLWNVVAIGRNYAASFRGDLVQQWYEYFLARTERANQIEALIGAWKFLDVRESDPAPAAAMAEHFDAAEQAAERLDPKDRATYVQNLFFTAEIYQDWDRAARYAGQVAAIRQEADWYYYSGKAQARRQAWSEAAQAYEKAWQRHAAAVRDSAISTDGRGGGMRLQPNYLYLAGMAYGKAGKTDLGESLVQRSRVLCLGDLQARDWLAKTMDANGDEELAAEERALIARLSQPDEFPGILAFYHLADDLSQSDPERAIAYMERFAVARHLLGASMSLQFTSSIRLRTLTHLWQTRAHLRAGNVEAALNALESYWQLAPGNASIGEEMLPMIEDAGKAAEAKAYYEKTRAFAKEACRLFPNFAMAHNNLAWLDSRSRRHLDEALKHAETAVRLRPRTAAYLDTLAEVHFALGNREKALELSTKAVKLAPYDKELSGQRDRFQNAPLPVKRTPDE